MKFPPTSNRMVARHVPVVPHPSRRWIWPVLAAMVSLSAPGRPGAADDLIFNRDIRPILADKCFACHGLDAKNRQAGLRLDTAAGAFGEDDGPVAIVAGKPQESELWVRITSDDEDLRMPPEHTHKPLTDQEKERLRAWIASGAPYQKHWAFEPVVSPDVPTDLESEYLRWCRNPVDHFIARRLKDESVLPSTEADRPTLVRRVAFALTGLPPTPEEQRAYLEDTLPGAYERMVDRYLESPHYGEEMARHWLDVARYADTHGMHLDNERQMWAYRDWVIESFNRNQPFDQFTIEQLAGDLLADPRQDQLVATGFNRCNVTTSEGGSIDAELLFRYAVDRASTTAQTWLGLTAGCAVCHDHKFDPISQREFYSLYAFFYSAADPAMDGNALLTPPILKLETAEQREKLERLDRRMADKRREIDRIATQLEYVDPSAQADVSRRTVETVWVEDAFPSGGTVKASPGHPTQFVGAEQGGVVFSGSAAVRRTDDALAQDVWESQEATLLIPAEGQVFAYVWLDPQHPPRSIMLQFHREEWLHRAVWGDYDAIPWGAANTTEKHAMGPLPEAGQWVRLEIPVADVGLNAGDSITGFALTQYGGTVYWDKVGVQGIDDPAHDPRRSFLAWWRQAAGNDTKGLEESLNQVAKAGPDGEVTEAQRAELLAYYVKEICDDTQSAFAPLRAEIEQLSQQRKSVSDSIPSTFVFADLDQPRQSHVMMRGQYDKPGEAVEPAIPAALPALVKQEPNGRATRLDLARWVVDERNPLTARVTVNRFWQQLFGTGLVKTSYDFGTQGESPSHPELLDWLAVSFREGGWNVKELMRLLVCSATFRQDAAVRDELQAKDPTNRLLGRGPRLRLDAEQIRDNALFVSGLADLRFGGAGVKPYQPPNIWEPVGFVGSNTRVYQQDSGSALYRRSIYTFIKRTAPPPFMSNFDAPNREQFCTVRQRSNTPLQALQLMNDVQHVEAARNLAQRMLREGGTDDAQRVEFAYRLVLARRADAEELQIISRQLEQHRSRYIRDIAAARKLIAVGESKPDDSLDTAELAAYTLVANMILNLDETLTRN